MRSPRSAWRLAALLVGLVVVAAGCGDQGGTAGPAKPIQAGPTPAPSTQAASRELTSGPLAPGLYTTATYRPRLSFKVGADWALLGELPNGFLLAYQADPTGEPKKVITVSTINWVFDKPLLTDREVSTERDRHIRPAPRDLLAWLRAHPYLHLGTPKRVTLGGVDGQQFDVTVKKIPGPSNCQQFAPAHCVTLFPITRTGEPVDLAETDDAPSRYTLLRVGGKPVLVVVSAPKDQKAAFVAEADKLLRTVSFG